MSCGCRIRAMKKNVKKMYCLRERPGEYETEKSFIGKTH